MSLRFRPRVAVLALAALALMIIAGPAAARHSLPQPASPPADFAATTDQIIVRVRPSGLLGAARAAEPAPDAIAARLSAVGGTALAYAGAGSAADSHLLRLPENLPLDQVEAIAARLAADPEVAYAEPNTRVFISRLPTDPCFVNAGYLFGEPCYDHRMWHLRGVSTVATPGNPVSYGVNLPAAWDVTTGSPAVVVAVIDTGALLAHSDLAGRTPDGNPGYDVIGDIQVANDGNGSDPDPSDPGDWSEPNQCGPARASSWHGSHVAGTIGASANNGVGVAGVNWNSKLLHVRALGRCGGYIDDIARAVEWAAGLPVLGLPLNPNPARVINMSLGGYGTCTSTMQLAINAANAKGAVIVVAAGNDGANLNDLGGVSDVNPAECSGVITVASTRQDGRRARYSNYGQVVDIAAPGGDGAIDAMVVSAIDAGVRGPEGDSYATYEGTSMAAPHVAGVISLMLSANPGLASADVLAILQQTATPFPAQTTCTTTICGAGIVNAGAAVEEAARRVRTVSWKVAEQRVSEGAGSAKLRVQLSIPSSQPVQLPFTVSGSAGPDDATLVSGSLTIPAGFATGTITFPIADDKATEGDETVVVTLGAPLGAPAPATLSGSPTHTVTIVDNEGGDPAPVLTLAQLALAEKPGSVEVSIAVERKPPQGAVGVSYTIRAVALGGAVTQVAEGELSLGASQNTLSATLPVDRALLGSAQSVEVELSAPTGGAVLGADRKERVDLVGLSRIFLPLTVK